MVVHWGKWYKSIYEMMPGDKPDDALINDDIELDKWFDSYIRDIAIKQAQMKQASSRNAPPRPQAVPVFGG